MGFGSSGSGSGQAGAGQSWGDSGSGSGRAGGPPQSIGGTRQFPPPQGFGQRPVPQLPPTGTRQWQRPMSNLPPVNAGGGTRVAPLPPNRFMSPFNIGGGEGANGAGTGPSPRFMAGSSNGQGPMPPAEYNLGSGSLDGQGADHTPGFALRDPEDNGILRNPVAPNPFGGVVPTSNPVPAPAPQAPAPPPGGYTPDEIRAGVDRDGNPVPVGATPGTQTASPGIDPTDIPDSRKVANQGSRSNRR